MLIVKRSLDVQAAEWLLDAVLEGRLEPGKPVTEGILAQEMGLSRSTVRTALQRLCSDGLVVQRPYEGWEVLPLTASHVRDLYAVRTALETLAAKLAAKAVTARSRSDLANAMEALKRAIRGKKKRAIAEADLNVHLAIARASGNQRLITYCEQMNKSILLYIVSSNLRTSGAEMLRGHQELVDAVSAGHAEEAESLVASHLADAAARLKEGLPVPGVIEA